MSNRPLFSILLPTKNRSDIVRGAIASVTDQSFHDWELIIADNDDREIDNTFKVVFAILRETFNRDKIHYIRAGGLSIHDNWQEALKRATGHYVLVIQDKYRLVPGALETLAKLISKYPNEVISYLIQPTTKEKLTQGKEKAIQVHTSNDLVLKFVNFDFSFFDIQPRVVNSVVPMELIRKIQKDGKRLFTEINQDYSAGFRILNTVPFILHYPVALVYIPNNWFWNPKYSNGIDFYHGGEDNKDFYRHLGLDNLSNATCYVGHSLILDKSLWINLVIFDYIFIWPNNGLAYNFIHWDKYYAFCLVLIELVGRKSGAKMDGARKAFWERFKKESLDYKIRIVYHFLVMATKIGWRTLKNKIS